MEPISKVPGTKRLKLNYDKLLSSFAFYFSLRRYMPAVRVGGSLHHPKLVFFNQILAAHQAGAGLVENIGF